MVLKDQFQMVGVVLASDWCQKTFAQSQSNETKIFLHLHHKYIQTSYGTCHMFTRGEKFQSQHKM